MSSPHLGPCGYLKGILHTYGRYIPNLTSRDGSACEALYIDFAACQNRDTFGLKFGHNANFCAPENCVNIGFSAAIISDHEIKIISVLVLTPLMKSQGFQHDECAWATYPYFTGSLSQVENADYVYCREVSGISALFRSLVYTKEMKICEDHIAACLFLYYLGDP